MPISEADRKKLLAEAQRRVSQADGGNTSTLATQRQTAEKYYRGDPFGNEVTGRSQVVSRDVAQYVDSQMPSLMRVFASGDEVVVFEPTQQQDEDAAKQATDYVNWIWRQNDGFLRFHNWFKDGLLFKLGVVKIWWDDSPTHTREHYRGLTDEELAALEADEDIEVGDVQSRMTFVEGPMGVPMAMNVHDVDVVKTDKSGRVRVANVPPEEFVFGRRTKDDTDSDVFGHVTKKRKADLIADGFPADVVQGLASGGGDIDNDAQKLVRFRDVDDQNNADDPDEVEVVECYFRCALEDDEPAKLWQVTYCGSEILQCEEVDDHPFACVTPILMPHRLVGLSTADQTMDIQLVKSTIWRQMLDNMYLQNAPQIGAVEGQVNLDDLLTRRPGGVVRMKTPGAITPIPTTPLGQEPYQMIEYLDSQGENRTGATRYNQGLDANTLNKTASGINMIQNAAAQRLELIARVFAETGVKRAFRRILSLVQRHQTKEQVIRLRGQWVTMDPRSWSNSMDMSVTVGLGNGNKDQIVAHLMTLLQMDTTIVQMQQGVQGPLVTAGNIYAKLKKLCEAIGLRSVEAYYTDPDSPEMQQALAQRQPPPDPKMIEAQGKMALEREQAAHDQQLAQQKMQNEAMLAQQKANNEALLARQKAEHEAQLEAWKVEQQAKLAAMQADAQIGVDRFRAGADMEGTFAKAKDLEGKMDGLMTIHGDVQTALDDLRREREAKRMEEEARAEAERLAEEEDMARGPSDEYKAMATMADTMARAVTMLAEVQARQVEQSDQMVALLKKVAAPKRAIRDKEGKVVGVEAAE